MFYYVANESSLQETTPVEALVKHSVPNTFAAKFSFFAIESYLLTLEELKLLEYEISN